MMSLGESGLRNEMILASAGSGKTYQLTNRYIGLMAAGVAPDRIIALTFTRKAAGEFFESILTKLAGAAGDPEACRSLARDLGSEGLTTDDFQRLLRHFVDQMHRLFLGTLDSFFVKVIRNFPFEFGLSGDFEILDEHQLRLERERVYRQVFRRSGGGGGAGVVSSASAQQEFLESFKLATFGREENAIIRELDRFVDEHHAVFVSAPDAFRWGNPRVIWPQGTNWTRSDIDLDAEFGRLFEAFAADDLDGRHGEKWRAFRDASVAYVPGTKMAREITYLLNKILEVWSEIENGGATIKIYRYEQVLSAGACEVVHVITSHLIGGELEVQLRRTRGIWSVMRHYETAYSQLVRRRGKLTFSDIPVILGGHRDLGADADAGPTAGTRGPVLSQTPGGDERLRIDFRIDGRYDHWLLDEFQDTNFLQWRAIENLVDEALQDTGGERSVFQVGDIKQAIYAWRGGDTQLFNEILDRYNRGGEKRIEERHLDVSWRSGPDVIEMVNRIFGDAVALGGLFPAAAVGRWQWGQHRSQHRDWGGYAALWHPRETAGEEGAGEMEQKMEIVAAVLDEVQPVRRALTCAVLVQTNESGRQVVDYIRGHSDIPVLSESEISVGRETPLNTALLSLLRFAAHPGDTLAWWHVRMTPFDEVLAGFDHDGGSVAAEISRDVFRGGFEATLQKWLAALGRCTGFGGADAFSRRRADDLLLAAQLFDRSGNRSISEFLAYAEGYTVREPETPGVVHVMTVHKAKGLGFDVVILPDLKSNALATARRGIGVKRDARRDVEWVLAVPSKDIANADPTLHAYRADQEADACFESLCKYYVAMTRAKLGMYLITHPVGSSKSKNFPMLLERTLDAGEVAAEVEVGGGVTARCVFESGDRRWFESHPAGPPAAPPTSPPAGQEEEVVGGGVVVAEAGAKTSFGVRARRLTPSGSETHEVTAAQLFSRSGKRAREFGTLAHLLMEQVEWLDETTEGALRERWDALPESGAASFSAAVDEVLACLRSPAVAASMARPSPGAVCWRERRFEIILDGGDWVSGTCDRVVVESGAGRAVVTDFKTDRIGDGDGVAKAVAGYRAQLEIYRRVISRMARVPVGAVKCQILFTKTGQVVEV